MCAAILQLRAVAAAHPLKSLQNISSTWTWDQNQGFTPCFTKLIPLMPCVCFEISLLSTDQTKACLLWQVQIGGGGQGKKTTTLQPIHPSLFIPLEIDLAECIRNELISRELIGMLVKRQEERGEQIHDWMAGGFKQPERSTA